MDVLCFSVIRRKPKLGIKQKIIKNDQTFSFVIVNWKV